MASLRIASWFGFALACFFVPAIAFSEESALPEENAPPEEAAVPEKTAPRYQQLVSNQLVSNGVSYLEAAQADDGAWSKQAGPAVTALAATALLRHGRTPTDPRVAKALRYLKGYIREDGGIYQQGTRYRNYETSLAIVCFSLANADRRFDATLEAAGKFLGNVQWDESEDHDPASPNYGGFGYGRHNRPDLSNTQIALDALYALGKGPDDPRVKKALVFISRCQNLETAENTTPFANKVDDGGFYYTPAAGGTSQAGETASGGLRSYGSMTYAGLKSMIYAGVSADDPRVKAAHAWIQAHYTLEENPGMGQQGLYYYYHTFAKALEVVGEDRIEETDGTQHDWRADLIQALAASQQDNGSWTNGSARWLEGDPNLVTAYALLALAHCQPGN